MTKTTAREQDRLDREDWVNAAFERLGAGGVEAVRVEPLAKDLGVTKGSFYWHFRDREALLDAVLEAWEARETDHYIKTAETDGGQPGERLRRFFRS